jgi:hypothetical protein
MTNAPRAIVVFVPLPAAGSPKVVRQVKPPPYPKGRPDPLPRYTPPADQIEALKRQGREVLDMVRAQRTVHGR